MKLMITVLVALAPTIAVGQEAAPSPPSPPSDMSTKELMDLDMDALMNMHTEVASKVSQSVRETPGVVTIVTRQEILASGARDLVDVLHLVSGVTFASDVQDVTSIAFRGIWAHEGKVLLLVDGQELNEPLYSDLYFGHHIPVANIERVEVIRGPGSVIYGGHAELGVINVISRTAEAIDGWAVTGNYGQLRAAAHGYSRRDLQLTFGKVLNQDGDIKLTATAFGGQGHRTAHNFYDGSGAFYNGLDTATVPGLGTFENAALNPTYVDIGLDVKGLKLRLTYDDYALTDRYPFDATVADDGTVTTGILDHGVPMHFTSLIGDVQYALHLGDFTITPRVNFAHKLPWHVTDTSPASLGSVYYDKRDERAYATLTASYDPGEGVHFIAGGLAQFDWAHVNLGPNGIYDGAGLNTTFGGADQVSYQNYGVYAQALWDNPVVNISAGARYEHHSAYGSSFVPRVAVTKVFDNLHLKGLASQAFRAPGIENINTNPGIKPERTTDYEVEVGYVLTKELYAGINLFDVTVSDFIYYYTTVSTTTIEGYNNAPQVGSQGGEAQLHYKSAHGFANLDYSFYTAAGRNRVPIFAVPGRTEVVLGIPQHKVTLNAGFDIGEHLVFGPSAVLLGPRWGYLTSIVTPAQTNWTLLANLFLTYRDLGTPGLDLSVGFYNMFAANYGFIQAYSNQHLPVPGLDRELMVRLSFAMGGSENAPATAP